MFDTETTTDFRLSLEDAREIYTGTTRWGDPIYASPSFGGVRCSFFYRCTSWDTSSLGYLRTSYPERFLIVLDEAYATNEKRKSTVNLTGAFLTSESEEQEAERQAAALNATATQRDKLRELVTAKRDAELEVTRLRSALALANEPIESAGDSRLIPIWVQAARAASAAGHCQEYDELASNIGALDRDDIQNLGYGVRDGARLDIEVTFMVTVEVDNWDSWRDEDYKTLAFEQTLEQNIDSDASYNVTNADRIDASERD